MALLRLFREVTERPGKMEDGGVVSFGEEGQLFGFAPRKHDLAVYISEKVKLTPAKLEKLGVHKKSGGCLFSKG